MKRKILKLFSCLITLTIIVYGLTCLTGLMERKSSREKNAEFFSQDENFDVLFMGTSHVINAVFPMELWNMYGIVSYNLGGHSNQIPTTYWTMENALDYTNPKIVVIDCLGLFSNRKCSDIFSYLHLSFDAFPLTVTKIKAIWDLLDDPALEEDIKEGNARESDEPRTKIGLLWDYSVYHSRWSELSYNDFSPKINLEKGAESRIAVTRGQLNKIPSDQKTAPGTTGDIYLRKMIEDCQARGISVLLTYIPFPANETQQEDANYVYDIAEEYGVDYINFLDMDIINYQTDLYDESHHLNPSGARKVTNYIGRFLSEKYEITDQRDNALYASWYDDYNAYNELKNGNLLKTKNMVEYLMLLSGDDITITLDIKNKDIFKNEWISNLLANIGIDTDLLSESTDFIIVQNRGQDVVVLDNFRDYDATFSTSNDQIRLVFDNNEQSQQDRTTCYSLYYNDSVYLTGNVDDNIGMQITVLRGTEIVDNVKYSYSVDPNTTIVNTTSVERDT